MRENWKLAIVGLGGIGGLLAGPLVRQYGDRISLVAHGKRGTALRERGLTLHSDVYGEFTVHPKTVAETPAELPVQDVVLICVKNGNLPEVAAQIAPIVGPETIVLTVMNGVTAGTVLEQGLNTGIVLESVIYTVSSAGADYSITQLGNFTYLHTGAVPGDEVRAVAAKKLAAIFNGAGVECRVAEDVRPAIWSKFVLNCAYNVATARWACDIGAIKADPARVEDCRALMSEARQVGLAMGVALPEDLVEKQLRRIRNTTDDSTSSLSRDFAVGRSGELEVFSGDVVRMAAKHRVPVPVTEQYYAALKEFAAGFSK